MSDAEINETFRADRLALLREAGADLTARAGEERRRAVTPTDEAFAHGWSMAAQWLARKADEVEKADT